MTLYSISFNIKLSDDDGGKKMKVSINEYMNNFDAQKDDFYGFFDWFCKDSSLKKRAESLLVKIKFLVENKIINPGYNVCMANKQLSFIWNIV